MNKKALFITLSLISFLFAQEVEDYQFGTCGGSGIYEMIAPHGYAYVEASTKEITQPHLTDEEFQKHLESYLSLKQEKKRNTPAINGFITIKVVGPNKDHEAGLGYAKKVFSRAEKMGVKKVIFGSQGARTAPEGYDAGTHRAEFLSFLKLILPEAQKHNLLICLEPLTADKLMPTIASAASMCAELNHPHLGIVPDFWHMMNNEDAPENIIKYKKFIKHVHLAEKKNRTAPGVSNQDLSAYWEALVKSEYTGLISIEGKWPKTHSLEEHAPVALKIMKEGVRDALEKVSPKKETHTLASVTYDNKPMGTMKKPLILRTYVPSLRLSDEVLKNHGTASPSPKYSPQTKAEGPGDYQPIDGIPAALSINHGKALSYVWDTNECRLLYAWKDGFLDMTKYWGTANNGRRTGFGYIPKIVGTLTYKAEGKHPLKVNGKRVTAPQYLGYNLPVQPSPFIGTPVFHWEENGVKINSMVFLNGGAEEIAIRYTTEENADLDYAAPKGVKVVKEDASLTVFYRVTSPLVEQLFPPEKTFKGVSVERGEHLFTAYSCQTCHTTDGGKNHGPTLKNLAGSKRDFKGTEVIADDAYLYESIVNPNAKIVPSYQANYMPQYPLKKEEVESLILYLKTFSTLHD